MQRQNFFFFFSFEEKIAHYKLSYKGEATQECRSFFGITYLIRAFLQTRSSNITKAHEPQHVTLASKDAKRPGQNQVKFSPDPTPTNLSAAVSLNWHWGLLNVTGLNSI